MVKEIYNSSRITVLIVIMIVIDAIMLLGAIPFLFGEYSLIGWTLLISALLVTCIFVFCIAYFKKVVNKNNTIMQLGYKTPGKVVNIGRERNHTDGGPRYKYWLDIQYTSQNGETKTFSSPRLGFMPQERNDITCDVYVYEKEVFATNFVNLYRASL